ncbi:MAG: cytochrome c3 family protein [Acidobacteria bacterium]|nr:cytochrome c3 family protein [Acidobacteriota bacterium]
MAVRKMSKAWLGVGVIGAALLAAAASPAFSPQDDDRTCLVCHDDAELKSSAGKPVYLNPKPFAASVHGRAGVGCIGCHADLKGFEDFPHARNLEAATCSNCHEVYGRTSPGGVHGTSSPRLAAKPVLCKDCHGTHDVLPSSDPGSSVHAANRPGTCGKCHPGATANFAKGHVHELPVSSGRSPAGIVKVLYKVFIGVMTGFFLLYVGVDLLRRTRERWTKKP